MAADIDLGRMLKDSNKAPSIPPLRRVNGWGFALLGYFTEPKLPKSYFSMIWFTIFFIPLFPLGIYIVAPGPRSKVIVAKVPVASFFRTYGTRGAKLYVSVIVHSIVIMTIVVGVVSAVTFAFRRH